MLRLEKLGLEVEATFDGLRLGTGDYHVPEVLLTAKDLRAIGVEVAIVAGAKTAAGDVEIEASAPGLRVRVVAYKPGEVVVSWEALRPLGVGPRLAS